MLTWLTSPRQAARQWVAGIVAQEFAVRDQKAEMSAQRLATDIGRIHSALASATIELPARPPQGKDAPESAPE